jgi:hypothetical protein
VHRRFAFTACIPSPTCQTSPLAPYVTRGPRGEPVAAERWATDHVEIICTILGTAASTGNTCESRLSYTIHNTWFGHRFADALVHNPADQTLTVDLDLFSEIVPEDPAALLKPQCF